MKLRGTSHLDRSIVSLGSVFFLLLCIAGFSLRADETALTNIELSGREIIDRAAVLPIDELRQLVYLYAHLNQPRVAEALAKKILAANPSDRQTLLVLASMFVEQKEAAATLRVAQEFLRYYPGDHQGRFFLGAGHYLAKHYAEANAILQELKTEQFASRLYPYETDLAAAAYAAGDWFQAMLSYQELLRHHRLGDELRDEVRRVVDTLYREHGARLEATLSETRLNHARVWRYGAAEASHLSERHWLALTYTRDDVTLESTPTLRAARSPRAEAAATLTSTYDRRWTSDVSIGASGEGPLGTARVHYLLVQDRTLSFEVTGNARATDSLALELIDGREDRAVLALNWLLQADLTLTARAQLRELHVAHAALGRGTSLDANLDYTFTREDHGPHIVGGYRGSLGAFTPDASAPPAMVAPIANPSLSLSGQQSLLTSLVSHRINRQGIGLVVSDDMAHAWRYRFTIGVDYDFELASADWNSALALSFFPRKSIELNAEAGYFSSATSSNAGSAATFFNFLIRSYY